MEKSTLFQKCCFPIAASVLFISASSIAQQPIPAAYDAGIKVSYVRTWDASAPETNASLLVSRPLRDVKQSTQYIDGTGRPLQAVVKQGSMQTGSTPIDLLTVNLYDQFGRETYKYLPFAANTGITNDGLIKNDPFLQQAGFMNQNFGSQGETWFYNETRFESSPLNRISMELPAGNSWVGAGKGTAVLLYNNTDADAVRKWDVVIGTIPSFSTYTSAAIYSQGQLTKTIITDEDNKQVITFSDKNDRIILKKVQLSAAADNGLGSGHSGWLCTYYLYDIYGNLRCVIQPRGVELISSNWTLSSTILAEQCFRYEYDGRNRIVMKKIPGANEIYMVYDGLDRLVMVQDAKNKASNKWLVTLYDNFNRPVQTGLLLNTYFGTTARTFKQHLDSAYYSTRYPFTITTTPAASMWECLTMTGYDNYSTLPAVSGMTSVLDNSFSSYIINTFNQSPQYAQSITQSAKINGLVTWSSAKVLNTSTYVYSVPIYDDKGRYIQVKTKNYFGGTDIITTQYSWSGQPLIIIQKIEKSTTPAQTSVFVSQNSYDDLGRLLKIEKKFSNSAFNGGAMSSYATVATFEYNALGQVKKKAVGSKKDPVTNVYLQPRQVLQEQLLEYNIRGWMLGLNRAYLATDGQTSDGCYFGYELGYDKIANKTGESFSSALFNGNITGAIWKSDGDDIRRKYDFAYDAANRLQKADFEQQNFEDHLWNNARINFSVKMGDGMSASTAYDANGNIKRMQQWGLKTDGTNAQIDDLTYNYANNNYSNKLLNVSDAFNDPQTRLGDFRVSALNPVQTKTATTTDYYYDVNGNMQRDLNKDIGNASSNGILYNHLNLPYSITVYGTSTSVKGTITYLYDASGNKIQKKVVENNATVTLNGLIYVTTITTITNYLQFLVFESKTYSNTSLSSLQYADKLLFASHEEGRIRVLYDNVSNPNSITDFAYDYFLKDHLGNVRMVLTEEVKTLIYPAATLEGVSDGSTNSMVNYEKQFYTIDPLKIIAESSIPGWGTETIPNTKQYYNHNGNPPSNINYPAGCTPTQSDGSTKLYKLNASSNKTGLEFMIRVMAGDKIDIFGKSYFQNTTTITNTNSTALDLLSLMTTFLLAPGSAIASKGFTASTLTNTNSGLIPSTFFRGGNSEASTTVPKAYINYLFFDEQLKFAGGNFSRVGSSGSVKDHWRSDGQLQNITVPKNGYLFVYVSNESNLDVYFDNLQVIHKPGPLMEETHYYPFGLTMAGISSRAAKLLENRFKFNAESELENKEFSNGGGLDLYTTDFRKYDPQLGRFIQNDLLGEVKPYNSSYVFASNCPIYFNDPSGLLDSIGLNNKGETIYHNTGDDLENVIVTPTSYAEKNSQSTNWLSGTIFGCTYGGGKTGKQIQRETNAQLSRKDQGLPFLTTSDTSYYFRSWQSDQDWKRLNYGVIGCISAPFILAGLYEGVTVATPVVVNFVENKSLQLWFYSARSLNLAKSELGFGIGGVLGNQLTNLPYVQKIQNWGNSFTDPVKAFKTILKIYDLYKNLKKLSP